jgi:hypothetical protein
VLPFAGAPKSTTVGKPSSVQTVEPVLVNVYATSSDPAPCVLLARSSASRSDPLAQTGTDTLVDVVGVVVVVVVVVAVGDVVVVVVVAGGDEGEQAARRSAATPVAPSPRIRRPAVNGPIARGVARINSSAIRSESPDPAHRR